MDWPVIYIYHCRAAPTKNYVKCAVIYYFRVNINSPHSRFAFICLDVDVLVFLCGRYDQCISVYFCKCIYLCFFSENIYSNKQTNEQTNTYIITFDFENRHFHASSLNGSKPLANCLKQQLVAKEMKYSRLYTNSQKKHTKILKTIQLNNSRHQTIFENDLFSYSSITLAK